MTRIISKTYFQKKFINCISKSTPKFTDISCRSDACDVSSIKVNLVALVSRSCFEPMLGMNKHKTIDREIISWKIVLKKKFH